MYGAAHRSTRAAATTTAAAADLRGAAPDRRECSRDGNNRGIRRRYEGPSAIAPKILRRFARGSRRFSTCRARGKSKIARHEKSWPRPFEFRPRLVKRESSFGFAMGKLKLSSVDLLLDLRLCSALYNGKEDKRKLYSSCIVH